MERKNLVIVRAGTESQHHKWIDKTESERNFDIVALSYGHQEDFFIKGSHDLFHYVPGPKLKGYQDWLQTNDHIFSKYNYIALLDDDIHTSHNDLDRLFAYCQALNISLAQPALTTDSYYSLLITRQHESFLHRWTNWVEIIAPFFKAELLRKCLKTFSLNLYGGGSME